MRQFIVSLAAHAELRVVGIVVGVLFAGAGCGSPGHGGETGDLAVEVNVPKTYPALEQVAYQVILGAERVAAQQQSLKSGNLQTSVVFVGLPAGPGYEVQASGTTPDGATLCTAAGKTSVTAHVTTTLSLTLSCSPAPALARVIPTFSCQEISSATAAPTTTSVGGKVMLRSEVFPSDADLATFQWVATNGKISEPQAANTTFTCGQVGPATLQLTAYRGNCFDRVTLMVNCVGGP